MPRRPGGAGGCLLAAGIVGLVGFLVVAVLGYGLASLGSLATPTPRPSVTTLAPTGTTPAPTTSVTPRPTPTKPVTPKPVTPEPKPLPVNPYTRQHPGGTYADDGYNPPRRVLTWWPTADSIAQAKRWRTSNSLYAHSVATPVRCARDPMRIGEMSVAAQQAGYDAVVACLMRIWRTPVERAGDTLPRPPVHVFTGTVTSACGKVSAVNVGGFYCTANGALFMNGTMRTVYNGQGQVTFWGEEILAHEFGHHVQARTGILDASWRYQYSLKGNAAHVEATRREVQAECFAALAMVAIRRSAGMNASDYAAFVEVRRRSAGGLPDHGTADTLERWLRKGFTSARPAQCNTFTAPESQVR
ncbi:neutral zinc metallopeptidase [Propionicicella superfundia]|uniref:neutral zinc metallopeptidase n=1 Tax=Propionicicella superfundia TaxID=348582 RepID=UPI0012EBFCFA|nr:neutral zinc metallopeptidase [Propionicicella superfundia]